MPALLPRCAIAVSQLPRCPMVSLSLSWAEAGEMVASRVRARQRKNQVPNVSHGYLLMTRYFFSVPRSIAAVVTAE